MLPCTATRFFVGFFSATAHSSKTNTAHTQITYEYSNCQHHGHKQTICNNKAVDEHDEHAWTYCIFAYLIHYYTLLSISNTQTSLAPHWKTTNKNIPNMFPVSGIPQPQNHQGTIMMTPFFAVNSIASALLINTPRRAATPVDTITAVGVANPIAQGQATKRTSVLFFGTCEVQTFRYSKSG